MAYKKQGSEIYVVAPKLPFPFGQITPLSTGSTKSREAGQMEAALIELATSHPEIVKRLLLPRANKLKLSLPDVYSAKLQNILHELAEAVNDPPLAEVIDEALASMPDVKHQDGLKNLKRLAPAGVKFSWLKDSDNIQSILEARECEGLKRNSVIRTLKVGIVKLLRQQIGKKGPVLLIMADVDYPEENDERDVQLTKGEIKHILTKLDDDELRDIATLALGTGIDQGVYTRLQAVHLKDMDGERPQIYVPDFKTIYRARTLDLPKDCAAILRRRMIGKTDQDYLFETRNPGALAYRWWWQMRHRVHMPHVRFKDLRSVFATYMIQFVDIVTLMYMMGHNSINTTKRYIKHAPGKDQSKEMEQVSQRQGRSHLRVG